MMEQKLECLLNDLALDQLIKSPIGDKLQQAIQFFQAVQNHYAALSEKQDEMEVTNIKVVTTLTFAILKKIADGQNPSKFNAQDWKEIATTVSKHAIFDNDQQYSIFIFNLYERYIRYSAMQIEAHIPDKTFKAINDLADELHDKAVFLNEGSISEATYTESCLWISLEAMIKLLACTVVYFGDERITDFTQALASYAFEYGRLMLYNRELEIVNQLIESQYQLDAELEQKYAAYLNDLQKESQQFYTLINNAFVPNFKEAFLHSILLAKAAGVQAEEILSSTRDIDSFFLD